MAGQARFVMVGPIALDAGAVARHAGAVELAGPVSRAEVPAWLEKFDVFFFPSTCEGSASAVLIRAVVAKCSSLPATKGELF